MTSHCSLPKPAVFGRDETPVPRELPILDRIPKTDQIITKSHLRLRKNELPSFYYVSIIERKESAFSANLYLSYFQTRCLIAG